MRLNLSSFTLVGATTRAGQLSAPLRDRFGVVFRLQLYSSEELKNIILRSASLLNIGCTESGALQLGCRARGTPRIANRLLKRARDFAQVVGSGVIDENIVNLTLDKLGVDKVGLESLDIKILKVIVENYGGGPVGIDAISSLIGEETVTVEDVYEPYLLQLGFIARTPRGRCATSRAYKYLGIERK